MCVLLHDVMTQRERDACLQLYIFYTVLKDLESMHENQMLLHMKTLRVKYKHRTGKALL